MDKMFFQTPVHYTDQPNTVWHLGREWSYLRSGDTFEIYGPSVSRPEKAKSVGMASVVFIVGGSVENLLGQLPWALDQHHDPSIRGVEIRMLRHLIDCRRADRSADPGASIWEAHATIVCFRWLHATADGPLVMQNTLGPNRVQFCRYCGAGVGTYRREGEGTCHHCDPEGCAARKGHVGPVSCS